MLGNISVDRLEALMRAGEIIPKRIGRHVVPGRGGAPVCPGMPVLGTETVEGLSYGPRGDP